VARDDLGLSLPVQNEAPFWSTRRTAAVVAGGASLASFGVAVGFVFSARSIYESSEPYCQANDVCEPTGIERRDDAREHGRIATVAATVGVTAAAAALTLWFSGSPDENSSRSVRLGVRGNAFAGAREGAVFLRGTY
jgi:hypothetical protein